MRRPTADDLSIGGLTDANRRLEEIADSLSRIASGQQRLSVSGPGARFAAAQRNAFLARAVGDPLQQRDAALALERAQRGFGGPNFTDRLTTFVRSTRFGAGGVSPLVGRGLDVLGVGGGPVALAATAAAAALKGLAEVTVGTVVQMKAFGEAARVSGGTPGQVAALSAMGIAPAEQAARAAQLQRTITEDQFGRMGATQLGLDIRPGLSAPANQLRNYERALEGLRKMGPTEDRLRLARKLGMEEDLKYLDVSKDVRQAQQEMGRATANIFDKKHTQAANDLDAAWGVAMQGLRNFKAYLSSDLMEPLTYFLTRFGEGATYAGPMLKGGLEGTFGPEAAWKKLHQIQQELIDATRENTTALRSQAPREGMFGGGEWARAALGRGMQGLYLGQALQGNALRMGAFRL